MESRLLQVVSNNATLSSEQFKFQAIEFFLNTVSGFTKDYLYSVANKGKQGILLSFESPLPVDVTGSFNMLEVEHAVKEELDKQNLNGFFIRCKVAEDVCSVTIDWEKPTKGFTRHKITNIHRKKKFCTIL